LPRRQDTQEKTDMNVKLTADTIHCGDAAELLAKLGDGSVDLTVTSPPYDNLREYHGYAFDFTAIALELFRVTANGGVGGGRPVGEGQ
jgi:site-specific DNA-methyltransferase (adenine-specific)